MKNVLFVLSLMLIPLSLFAATWQAFSYYQYEQTLGVLEARQQRLFEENKRLIASLAGSSSPKLIEERARQELGMDWPRQDQILKILLKSTSRVSLGTSP